MYGKRTGLHSMVSLFLFSLALGLTLKADNKGVPETHFLRESRESSACQLGDRLSAYSLSNNSEGSFHVGAFL